MEMYVDIRNIAEQCFYSLLRTTIILQKKDTLLNIA